jgi:hypothetical protein
LQLFVPACLGWGILHKLSCKDIDSLNVAVHVDDSNKVCAVSPIPTILAAHSLEVGGDDSSLIVDNAPEGHTINGFPRDRKIHEKMRIYPPASGLGNPHYMEA